MDNIRQTFYMDRGLKEKLRYLSYRDKKSQNDIMREALKIYFEVNLNDSDLKQIMVLKQAVNTVKYGFYGSKESIQFMSKCKQR